MKYQRFLLVISILFASLLTGCASNLQGDSYSRDDARQVQSVQYGIVEETRLVVIEGTKTPIGTIAGGAVGGVAGSSIGDGKGAAIATVVGAVAGGLAGSALEEEVTKSQGIELVIRLNKTNETIAIVQKHDPAHPFYAGDRVRLMTVNGQTRVSR
ncbi:MAG: glycine zipper 2TM domain-containing protein [Gammaproteobacteria bacterium]|nr:glycine zipper 2TM domain-containing protein [Gammaproteobacteria bacterium]MDT8370846.1 glycine zipper 2TM domain-containing protein [Gammaproteobacteria bacterium]